MASCVCGVLTSSLMMMVGVMMLGRMTVNGQGVKWTDQEAGVHLDKMSYMGGVVTLRMLDRLVYDLEIVKNKLTAAEIKLQSDYSLSSLPNATAYVEDKLSGVLTKLDEAETLASDMGLSNTDDGLAVYMNSPHAVVNIGNHYSTTTNVFTAPTYGLYKVLIRNLPHDSSFNCQVKRNGNETLLTLDVNGYYDVQTRIKLLYLNANDQIFTTGSIPQYFGVTRLRVQSVMPSFLDP